MFKNIWNEYRATLEEKAQKDEGNAFTKALNAAREKGDTTFTVAGKQYNVKTEMAKMGMSTEDIDHLCDSKYHVCAVVVEHPEWGVGKPLMGRHAEPDDEGNIAWYDVEFAHGIEEKVYADNFNILDEMSHGSKKKKTEDNTNDKSDDGEGMDKVQPKALKKKFKDRKDKDIDNDGDEDESDEYLHNRRKTVSKNIKKGKKNGNGEDEVDMNPKMESRIRKSLKSVLEANQSPNKDKAEKPEDALKGKGAKDMMNQPKDADDTQAKGHDDASKAGKVTKAAGARNGRDNVRSGDQKVVKGGTPMQNAQGIKATMEAYAQVQEISREKLGAYVKAADKDKIKKYAQSDMGKVSKADAYKNQQKRNKGIDMAKSKMKPARVGTNEGTIVEAKGQEELTMMTHDGEETHIIAGFKHNEASAKKVRAQVIAAAAKIAKVPAAKMKKHHEDMRDEAALDHHYLAAYPVQKGTKGDKMAGRGGLGDVYYHKNLQSYIKHHAKADAEEYHDRHNYY